MRSSAQRALGCVVAAAAAIGLSCSVRADDSFRSAEAQWPEAELQIESDKARRPPTCRRTKFCARVSLSGSSSKVDYQVFSLSNPNRVIVELPDVSVQLPTLGMNTSGRSR